MRKLMHAGFYRLWKNKLFWLLLAAVFFAGSVLAADYMFAFNAYGEEVLPTDGRIGMGCLVAAAAAGIFCTAFDGAEYADGTMRNKLTVGHGRGSVFCTALVLEVFVGVLMFAAYLAAVCIFAGSAMAVPENVPEAVLYLLTCFVVTAAFSCLFHDIGILIPNRFLSLVTAFAVFIVLICVSFWIEDKLAQPPMITDYTYSPELDVIVSGADIPNTQYVSGPARGVYTFFQNLLPSGQAIQIILAETVTPLQLVYMIAFGAACGAAGSVAFRRKDIA